jgi:protein-L-isoaspartate(D-aspartate) O-methyltransferase
MVIPIGTRYLQTLTVVQKLAGGKMNVRESVSCVFVPLLGAYGFKMDGKDYD